MAATARQSAKELRQKLSLVDRFLLRDQRVQTDRQAAARLSRLSKGKKPEFTYKEAARGNPQPGKELLHGPAFAANPHNFEAYKHPVTGRWIPPRLSLRRQAKLAKEAYKEGTFESLVATLKKQAEERDRRSTRATPRAGPTGSIKFDKMIERLEQLKIQERTGAHLDSYHEGLNAKKLRDQQKLAAGETVAAPSGAPADKRSVYHTALAHAATSRVYSGRSMRSIFKGTKAEREAPARQRKIAERLSVMDETIRAHKEGRREAKLKVKRRLPF